MTELITVAKILGERAMKLTRPPSPAGPRQDPQRSLHRDAGAAPGEHPGRSENPLVEVIGPDYSRFVF
jgi:hypothetical protein